MWVIDAMMAYDFVAKTFSDKEQTIIELNLFKPMVIIGNVPMDVTYN